MDIEDYDNVCFDPGVFLTGKGSSIAVVEQPARRNHPFFSENIKSYYASARKQVFDIEPQMHPSSTLAFMVGHAEGLPRIGAAPEADVHLFEINFFLPKEVHDQASEHQKKEIIIEEKTLLFEETLLQLQRIESELSKGRRYDAVVYFIGTAFAHGNNAIPQRVKTAVSGIREILPVIEKVHKSYVFHPSEEDFFFYGINALGKAANYRVDGPPVWGQDVPKGGIGVPIHDRIVASFKDDGHYRETKCAGTCWINATLAGGFALLRQAFPDMSKSAYYQALKKAARPVNYENGQRTRTINFSSAIAALQK